MLHIRNQADVGFYNQYFGQLAGATIEKTEMIEDEHEPGTYWPTLTVRLADGETVTCEISQDEEGNGPGFLFGLPSPPQRS